jgi:hypothetical protein
VDADGGIREGGITKANRKETNAGRNAGDALCVLTASNSSSTNIDDFKMGFFRDDDNYEEDSISLTASDFELLNNDHFFEQMTDMFSQGKMTIPDIKLPSSKHSRSDLNRMRDLSSDVSFKNPNEIEFPIGIPKLPPFDKNLNYQDEYWNIYLQN